LEHNVYHFGAEIPIKIVRENVQPIVTTGNRPIFGDQSNCCQHEVKPSKIILFFGGKKNAIEKLAYFQWPRSTRKN
jgi:hypothetical protein